MNLSIFDFGVSSLVRLRDIYKCQEANSIVTRPDNAVLAYPGFVFMGKSSSVQMSRVSRNG